MKIEVFLCSLKLIVWDFFVLGETFTQIQWILGQLVKFIEKFEGKFSNNTRSCMDRSCSLLTIKYFHS